MSCLVTVLIYLQPIFPVEGLQGDRALLSIGLLKINLLVKTLLKISLVLSVKIMIVPFYSLFAFSFQIGQYWQKMNVLSCEFVVPAMSGGWREQIQAGFLLLKKHK